MKRSAIYLGASAAILAIAGAFTTKGITKVQPRTAWTVGGVNTVKVTCNNLKSKTCRTADFGTTLYTTNQGAGHTLKTGV